MGYEHEWKPKYHLGQKVFTKMIDEPLYVSSIKASSGSETYDILYMLAKSMPGPYHATEYFKDIGQVHENEIITEKEFKEMKIEQAKKMLEKYSK